MTDGQINLSTEDPRDIELLDNKIEIRDSISLADLKSMTDTQYYLSSPCLVDEEGWMPLPLRYAYDSIIRLTVSNADIEKIVYSDQTQRYFIKFQAPVASAARIEYIVEEKFLPINPKIIFPVIAEQAKRSINNFIDQQLQLPQQNKFFEEILKSLKLIQNDPDQRSISEFMEKLQKYLNKFKNEPLTGENENPIFQIFKQQKGACRHRSFLFVILCQLIGIPAREYSNDLHAAAETIDDQGNVCVYDFGGADVDDIELTHRDPLLSQAIAKSAKRRKNMNRYCRLTLLFLNLKPWII